MCFWRVLYKTGSDCGSVGFMSSHVDTSDSKEHFASILMVILKIDIVCYSQTSLST
jgi:hypothetical protein